MKYNDRKLLINDLYDNINDRSGNDILKIVLASGIGGILLNKNIKNKKIKRLNILLS